MSSSARAIREREAITLDGVGLHTGARCSVTFEVADGPVRLCRSGEEFTREELAVAGTDRGVRVRLGTTRHEIELVEHLFAALGGLGVQHGLRIAVDGSEIPLLDGGASDFCNALARLDAAACGPSLEVTRAASYAVGASQYLFEPASNTEIDVQVEYGRRGPESAHWDGSRAAFVETIAPARTFGFASELDSLRARGRAAFVDPAHVVALDDVGRCAFAEQVLADRELPRHKLLDLVGDLYLYGGPPLGRIRAVRPGHGANHAMVTRALGDGVLHLR